MENKITRKTTQKASQYQIPLSTFLLDPMVLIVGCAGLKLRQRLLLDQDSQKGYFHLGRYWTNQWYCNILFCTGYLW